ncbi:acid phosphatase [Aquirhabdus parva]|uniref:Acid phosphatase n=1 Tax=Aquirhabdus parva TaxID=2283318 RepID=A0A345P480_9GAMM|nr:acid phosphatase [Aquirhabdus parva]AXI02089.1 acid phosphatase [Aquirhabdus parva]
MNPVYRLLPIVVLMSSIFLAGCGSEDDANDAVPAETQVTTGLQSNIKNVVVIYAENRGFDNIYGLFPGADGIPGVNPTAVGSYIPQTDRDDANTVFGKLPRVWGGVTAPAQSVTIAEGNTAYQDNVPFQIDSPKGFQNTGTVVDQSVITRDLYHRFYNNQMQINGGKNDKFAAYADSGGLVMGYYDGSKMALWNLAKQYVLADNFFQGAFGGSFLNHQYLICACAPVYPATGAAVTSASNSISVLNKDSNGNYLPVLTQSAQSSKSALNDNGAPKFVNDSALTPLNYAGDNLYHGINTMQPPYQPSAVATAAGANPATADLGNKSTLYPQTTTTIGDLLDKKNVSWAWYAGAWNAAIADAPNTKRTVIGTGKIQFQTHHQPFNYFSEFDPTQPTTLAYRNQHLKDFDASFLQDAAAGTLPAVSFYKPQGNLNQHAGYASIADGDKHIADVVAQLQKSPQWKNMAIVITYDENGGFWDHKAVPKGDVWGPGTRIPAIVISPWSKKGFVDHTQYDTASILRFITRRFGLDTLPGLAQRDDALVKNGGVKMGDLTKAFDFNQTPTP